jgi:23S rRNA (guanosine2251-2'-O)-methyltransferase
MIIYGKHVLETLLTHHPERIRVVYILREPNHPLHHLILLIKQHGISIQYLPKEALQKITGEHAVHQGIAAEIIHPILNEEHLDKILFQLAQRQQPPFLLLLDTIQDPHNLGACLRTAETAGVHAVILPKDRACAIHPTVYKSSSGAAGLVPILLITNLVETMKKLQYEHKIWCVGAAVNTEKSIYQANLTGALAIVMGNEEKGLRRLTRETCDFLYHIPMHGKIKSQNVSVATGIFLFEAVRQRHPF